MDDFKGIADTLLTILFVLVALMMTFLILLQEGKGGGLAALGGTKAAGVEGVTNPIRRATAYLAGIFFILAISLGFLHKPEKLAFEGEKSKPAENSMGGAANNATPAPPPSAVNTPMPPPIQVNPTPKIEVKTEAPKTEAKPDEKKTDAPKTEEKKAETPAATPATPPATPPAEEKKTDAPKAEEKKAEAPKPEEKKAEEKK